MDFPDFEEFRKTLTEEQMADFFGESMLKVYQTDALTTENINAIISRIAFDIMAQSARYSLNLLQAYHDWLQEQL